MDREKLIKHFEHLLNAAKGNYQDFVDLTVDAGEDILALLKEQEDLGTELTNAVELIHKKNERIEKMLKEQEAKPPAIMQDIEGIWSTCSMCGHKLRPILAMKMDTYFPKFCSECGQAVKWN